MRLKGDPVVVGIDGSDSCDDALDWACSHAQALGLGLRLVHAFVWPLLRVRTGPSDVAPGLRAAAEKMLADAESRAKKLGCDDVSSQLVEGFPTPVLAKASESAHTVVLGGRSLGQVLGLLVGSRAYDLSSLASCPVVVLRPGGVSSATEAKTDDPVVVVGYDGSLPGERAVDFALETAQARGWRLHIVIVRPPQQEENRDEIVHHGLDELLVGWREHHPSVAIDHEVRRGRSATAALVDAARGAELVVVGSRGAGGFAGLLLGSTCRAVLAHASCPVAVVPVHPDADEGAT
jgi:nucleotide-binding universal stress UspA family protein